MESWPNLFIVGAPKAGTTTLYEYLRNIPDIFMSPVKEPHFFDVKTMPADHPYTRPIRDKKKYLKLFSKAKDEKLIGEASPTYLADPDAPKLIHEVSPKAKIIISLRDPVERVYSFYLMASNQTDLINLPFHEQLIFDLTKQTDRIVKGLELDKGKYFDSVKRYVELFGEEQVKIIFFEEFVQSTEKIINEIADFLGIKQTYEFKAQIVNPYGVPRSKVATHLISSTKLSRFAKKIIPSSARSLVKDKVLLKPAKKPKMTEEDRNLLKNYYKNDVEKLKTFLRREIPWPNF